jgi:hypothetical protein
MNLNTLSGDFIHSWLIRIYNNNDNKTDTAYINLIADEKLTISFKQGLGF